MEKYPDSFISDDNDTINKPLTSSISICASKRAMFETHFLTHNDLKVKVGLELMWGIMLVTLHGHCSFLFVPQMSFLLNKLWAVVG